MKFLNFFFRDFFFGIKTSDLRPEVPKVLNSSSNSPPSFSRPPVNDARSIIGLKILLITYKTILKNLTQGVLGFWGFGVLGFGVGIPLGSPMPL